MAAKRKVADFFENYPIQTTCRGVSTLRARYAIYMRECYKYNCFVYALLTIILSMISCSCPLN